MRILGVDPGTSQLGCAVVDKDGSSITHRVHTTLSVKSKEAFPVRLGKIATLFCEFIFEYKPDIVVVEKIFLGRNVDSAFKLGHIRGVCFHQAYKYGAEIVEYAPRLVKQGITGAGNATKEQVQMILYSQLEIPGGSNKAFDASDALSLAYYHATRVDLNQMMASQGMDV